MIDKKQIIAILAAAVAGELFFVVPTVAAGGNDDCLMCHGQKDTDSAFVDGKAFSLSIHGKNLCVSCHQDAKELPHAEKLAPVSCAKCHRLEAQIYRESDHGRAVSAGRTEAAACKDCHGHSHTLLNSRNPASPVNRNNIRGTCAACHGKPHTTINEKLTERKPVETYDNTVHGIAFHLGKTNAATCSDCHGTHDLHGSANAASRVNRANIPETCGRCHPNVLTVYRRSIHGQASANGIKESPVCTDCHGEHTIRSSEDPASSVFRGEITKTCSSCHESERIVNKFGLPAGRLKSYMDTYHGMASKRSDLRVANCASCHGWHDVLPSKDPRSSINPANLSNTCSQCHSGAQVKMMSGRIHTGKETHPPFWIWFFRWFYRLVIPLTLGGMLLHNLLDFLRKLLHPIPASDAHEVSVLRLNVQERVQHAVLSMVFLILACSGFALEFSTAWWAAPFQWLGGESARKGIHRWTALFFVLTGAWHVGYMCFTRRGRFLWRVRLRPKLRDVLDPIHLTLFNLGLKKYRPAIRYPSYIERAEYWALVWGAVVMILTGAVLVFNNLTLQNAPLWVPELAAMVHYYEAVLACLSVIVWHGYWTVLDPAVYPMSWAWISGRLRRRFRSLASKGSREKK